MTRLYHCQASRNSKCPPTCSVLEKKVDLLLSSTTPSLVFVPDSLTQGISFVTGSLAMEDYEQFLEQTLYYIMCQHNLIAGELLVMAK